MDHNALSLLAGVGLGAGLMYILDPSAGDRRRTRLRERAADTWHDVQDGVSVLADDVSQRARTVADDARALVAGGADAGSLGQRAARLAGDVAAPGREMFQAEWSSTTRATAGVAGLTLLGYGFTQNAPWACALGTAGLALMFSAVSDEGFRGLMPEHLTDMVPDAVRSRFASAEPAQSPHAGPRQEEKAEIGAPYAAGF